MCGIQQSVKEKTLTMNEMLSHWYTQALCNIFLFKTALKIEKIQFKFLQFRGLFT